MLPMIYVIQGRYGFGWEDLTASEDWDDVVSDLADYQRAEPRTPFKIIKRRQKEGE